MANFYKAYKKLSLVEGGYSNDPYDPGQETYKGISRKFHPDWAGWKIIDKIKEKIPNSFVSIIESDPYLNDLTEVFYKRIYWDYFCLDEIKDQSISHELFESSVNVGKSETTKFLQKSLNLLNRNQTIFEDIAEDGHFGPKTKVTLFACLKNKDGKYLFNLLNIFQGYKYIRIGNERFIRGWLKRINIRKK